MALLGDVEGVAVVGAEGEERRGALGEEGAQRVQVLRDEPSRISTVMPLRIFSSASCAPVASWSVRMPAAA